MRRYVRTGPARPTTEVRIHADNKQILVRMAEGIEFRAAITHTEKEGQHQVMVAAAEVHLPLLRMCAEPLLKLLSQQHNVPLDHIAYFERGPDHSLFRVDTHHLAERPPLTRERTPDMDPWEGQHPASEPEVEEEIEVEPEVQTEAPSCCEEPSCDHQRPISRRYRF